MESTNSILVSSPRDTLRLSHGWSLELTCPTCGKTSVPKVNGWTPSFEVHFGDVPTIYAQIHCPTCGTNLKKEAGEKLVQTFSPITIPSENRDAIALFLFLVAVLPFLVMGGWALGAYLGWWQGLPGYLVAFLPLFTVPAIYWFNNKVHKITEKCECGQPDYEFMGMLGRTYCHRCRKCGRLLRLSD